MHQGKWRTAPMFLCKCLKSLATVYLVCSTKNGLAHNWNRQLFRILLSFILPLAWKHNCNVVGKGLPKSL